MTGDVPVRASLRSLEAKGLIVANRGSVLPGQPEYSFRHALKREVAYRSIPRAQRGRAHAAVAGWIEDLAGDRRAEFAELIAYHYETAAAPLDAALAWPGDLAERERVRAAAVRALVTAGDQARARLALDHALRFADRALELATSNAERLATLELRASALHAAVRCDEALAAYRTGLELAQRRGDTGAYSRLRGDAVLLCARFPGAFTDDSWKRPAVERIERGLAERGADQVTFEVGALLVGRSAMSAGWLDAPTGHEPSSERDARRAIEIAETLDSPYLLSRAVESLIAHALGGGLCGAAELAERLVAVSESLSDRAEVHEGLITASITLARAGRHGRAHQIARRATEDSERLSPHQSMHAAAAEVMCLLPAGRFDELLRMTAHVPSVVRDEGGRLCQVGALALAGRALALFESGERDAAEDALALLEAAPPPAGLSTLRPLAIEIVRPLAGLERTRRRAAELGPAASRAAQLYALRLDLQLSALAADWGALDGVVAEARELASSGCAPTLGWIADWADAVARAGAGDSADAVRRATNAAEALSEYGEPYTAARLLVDLLPFLDADLRGPLARDVGKRLEAMGASASAAEPQGLSGRAGPAGAAR
jgi:hypothetical protein